MTGPTGVDWFNARGRRERRVMVSHGSRLQQLATPGLRKCQVWVALVS